MKRVFANCADVCETSSQLENALSKIGAMSAECMVAIWEVALIGT